MKKIILFLFALTSTYSYASSENLYRISNDYGYKVKGDNKRLFQLKNKVYSGQDLKKISLGDYSAILGATLSVECKDCNTSMGSSFGEDAFGFIFITSSFPKLYSNKKVHNFLSSNNHKYTLYFPAKSFISRRGGGMSIDERDGYPVRLETASILVFNRSSKEYMSLDVAIKKLLLPNYGNTLHLSKVKFSTPQVDPGIIPFYLHERVLELVLRFNIENGPQARLPEIDYYKVVRSRIKKVSKVFEGALAIKDIPEGKNRVNIYLENLDYGLDIEFKSIEVDLDELRNTYLQQKDYELKLPNGETLEFTLSLQ